MMISVFAAFLMMPPAAQPLEECPPIEPAPPICERFKGSFSFRSTEGLRQVDVVIRQWHIANETELKIPHQGFLIVNLRAGALVAQTGDEQKEWRADSSWSVEAKDSLIVRTARDSVVLQTVDFIEQ